MRVRNGQDRLAPLIAVAGLLLASCSGGDPSSPSVVTTSQSIAGSYVLEGSQSDVLVLASDGDFCMSQDGFALGGSYDIDGDALTLRPEMDGLGEEVGSIDGDVVTDPDGERWIRSDEAATCEPTVSPGGGGEPAPGTEEVAELIGTTGWPSRYEDAVQALRTLPDQIAGFRATDVQETEGESSTASVAYPDPAYDGPVSGLAFVVMEPPPGVTPEEMVDVTAHLGFGLQGELSTISESTEIPLIVGRIVQVEGAGELPAGQDGYLAVWASGDAVYAVTADGMRSLETAISILGESSA